MCMYVWSPLQVHRTPKSKDLTPFVIIFRTLSDTINAKLYSNFWFYLKEDGTETSLKQMIQENMKKLEYYIYYVSPTN